MSKYSVGVVRFSVGDRIGASGDDKQCLGTVINVNKKTITITWGNGLSAEYTPKQIQSYGYQKFLEEKEAIASCNSNTLVSSQESEALTSELKPPEQPTESLLNSSLKITATLKQYSVTDFPISPNTATSKTIAQSLENSTSTQSASLAPAPALQATERDLNTQNQNSGLKPCGALPTVAPVSSSLKILQDLSTKDYEQFLGDSEWLATSGMIRKSYQLRNLDRPKREKGFLSLPTPTTYAKGSTGCRPAGATRLEQKLRPYIIKGDKLNPAVPGWMMGFPVGWAEYPLMDTGEAISVQLPFIPEYATISTNDAIVTTSTPDQFAPSKLRSPYVESSTLTQSLDESTPEIFLEETKEDTKSSIKPKRRQRKGCLYKYLENKKLKSGSIVSYPRVIGHREPSNPQHWRWGFNWEEKIDGEWKGRSIGSVPLGAIALIQSMQNEGVSLEEIIGFIRRAKAKK